MRVAVLTISDSVTKGERGGLSAPRRRRSARAGWEVTSALRVVGRSRNIREQLRELADSGRVGVLLTTAEQESGRDNTPEATQAVADRIVPGISEEMRRKGLEHTPTAVLSRGAAAVQRRRSSLTCRGARKGAVESLEAGGALAAARGEGPPRCAARLSCAVSIVRAGGGKFAQGVHRFAQRFEQNLIDGANGNLYLARQIEPEA